MDEALIAEVRARTVMAWGIMGIANALASQGLAFGTNGFTRDQQNRERDLAQAYSLGLPGLAGKYVWFMSGKSIDLLDLMFMQIDIGRAFHEGFLGETHFDQAMGQIAKAYTTAIKNKSSLRSIEQIFNLMENPEYGIVQLLGDQTSGLLPWSGLQGNVTRTIKDDPNMNRQPKDSRYLDHQQAEMLEQDQLAPILRPVVQILQQALDSTVLSIIPGTSHPRERDWRGNRIVRPFNMPLDAAIPFRPVGIPQDKNLEWEVKHGFGEPPREDRNAGDWVRGKLQGTGVKAPAAITMNDEEYDSYRVGFREEKGTVSSEQLLAGRVRNSLVIQQLGGLDQFVIGNDFQGAITALRTNEQYNQMLESETRLNPSRQMNPFDSLDTRRKEANEPLTGTRVYDPVEMIYEYYDQLGMQRMLRENPGFVQRVQKLGVAEVEEIKESAGAFWGLGRR